MRHRNHIAAAALLLLGLAQMTGAVLDLPTVKGLAAGTAASPAPKVFSSVKGLETFSTAFSLHWTNDAGEARELPLTHEIYPRLQGPYNRRNVWGAMLAYGPVLATEPLTQPMFDDIVAFGMCAEAPVLRELGVDPSDVNDLHVSYTPREGTVTALPMTIQMRCPL